MLSGGSRDRLILLAYALLILFAPIAILTLTLGFLSLTGDIVLGELTPLEFLELYIIELVLIVGFGYGIYRVTLWVVEHRVPVVLDKLDDLDEVEVQDGSQASDENDR